MAHFARQSVRHHMLSLDGYFDRHGDDNVSVNRFILVNDDFVTGHKFNVFLISLFN